MATIPTLIRGLLRSSRELHIASATRSFLPNIEQTGEQGQVLGAQELKDTFFETPQQFNDAGSADALLRHLTDDLSNALDTHLVDDLRDFLVDPPDGMDLAAINIERGRDLGLGTLNETRVALGLDPYTSFDQITSDPETAANLATAFGSDVDKVDLWTGGLAENHVDGAMVGETFTRSSANNSTRCGTATGFFFENQGFDRKDTENDRGHHRCRHHGAEHRRRPHAKRRIRFL